MRARLFPMDDSRGQSPVVLDSFPVILGIGDDAQLQISEEAAAAPYCQIDMEQGTLVAVDLDSPGGTWVNGESIQQAPLMPGDKLVIGHSSLVVSYERLTRRPPPDVLYRSVSQVPVASKVGEEAELLAIHEVLDFSPSSRCS